MLIAQPALIFTMPVTSIIIPDSAFGLVCLEKRFGAGQNPTGNPIGGGEGYSDIVTPMDSQVRYPVTTRDELLVALKNADSGDVVYIDANAQIDLTNTPEVIIPAGVTLAGNRGAVNTTGAAVYSFTTGEPGEYTLWGLVSVADENDSSFWVRVDGKEGRLWDLEPKSDWYWSREGTYNLSAGHHTLTIRQQEDGSKLDGFLITDEPGYVPVTVMGGQHIWIEAESGAPSPPVEIERNLTASGGMCIVVPKGAGMGEPPVSPGGLIYQSSATGSGPDTDRYTTMFKVTGQNVRITGLRLQGPDNSTSSPQRFAIFSTARNLEVDNCEIFGWGYAGVALFRTGGVSDMKIGGYIHHNYIHHCQRSDLGYGVEVGQGGEGLIEANKFDYCRHAVAGTGDVNNGYEVCYNIFGPNFPMSNTAHVVDMHGVSTPSGNVAGDRLVIHHNTFEAISTTDYSIAIRGIPRTGAYIDHNWIKYTGAPIGRTGVTTSQLNVRMYIGENKGPSGQILTTLQQRIFSTSLA